MSDRIGTIEEGKLADLIVVNGDPLDDISVLHDARNVALVMRDGKVMKGLAGPGARGPESR
jgi:imidazolonepropionase-like amidohydrolase